MISDIHNLLIAVYVVVKYQKELENLFSVRNFNLLNLIPVQQAKYKILSISYF